jgi:c-di-AMP phosphodiesterase-like protein
VKRFHHYFSILFTIFFVSSAEAGQSTSVRIQSYLDGYKLMLAREIAYSIGERSQRISDTMRIVALSGNFDTQIYNSFLIYRMENTNKHDDLPESSLLNRAHVRNREVLRKMFNAYYAQLSHENVLLYLKDITKSNEHAYKYSKIHQIFLTSLLSSPEDSNEFLQFIQELYELMYGKRLTSSATRTPALTRLRLFAKR